jgi:hypothetical protein
MMATPLPSYRNENKKMNNSSAKKALPLVIDGKAF